MEENDKWWGMCVDVWRENDGISWNIDESTEAERFLKSHIEDN